MTKVLSNWFNPKSLLDSLKIIQLLTCFNGLLPFYLDEKSRKLRINKISIITAVAHYLLYVICFIIALNSRHLNATLFKTEFSEFAAVTHRVTSLSIATSIFTFSLIQRNCLLRIIQLYLEIDSIFKKLYLTVKYQDITNLTIFITSGIVCFKIIYHAICSFLFHIHTKPSVPMQVVFILPSVLKWIFILVFIVIVYVFKLFLKVINLKLKNMITTYSKSRSIRKNDIVSLKVLKMCPSDVLLVTELIHVHNLICEVLKWIEKYFGYTILVIIALHFFSIVLYCFYLLDIWLEPGNYFQSWNEYGMVSIVLTQIIFANVQHAGFIEICQKSLRQNQNISMNICKLLNLNITPELREQLELFALKLENVEMKFTLLGIFDLDRTVYLMVRMSFLYIYSAPDKLENIYTQNYFNYSQQEY